MTWSIGRRFRAFDRPERPVGRVPERHQADAEAILGDAEDLAGERLVIQAARELPMPRSAAASIICIVA